MNKKISLVVKWLRLHTFNAEDAGSMSSQGTEIPNATRHGQIVLRKEYEKGTVGRGVCFSMPGSSSRKAQSLGVMQQLKAGLSWNAFTHLSDGWCCCWLGPRWWCQNSYGGPFHTTPPD